MEVRRGGGGHKDTCIHSVKALREAKCFVSCPAEGTYYTLPADLVIFAVMESTSTCRGMIADTDES